MLRNQARSYLMKQRSGSAVWAAATVVLLVLLGTISLVSCTWSKETRTATFSVGSSPAVDIEVGNGDLALVVGLEGEISITAELQEPDKVEYEVSQDGDLITVRAETEPGSRADVTVTVPQNCTFGLSTGNGRVEAAGVQASGQVQSGNGSIVLEGIRGDVQASIGNGDITLDDVEGAFVLNDGNGNIILRDAVGSFILNNGNGDVTFQGELTLGSDNSFSVGNGSVTLELTDSPSVALDLETDDGDVEVELQVTVHESSEGRLVGTIGDGEAALTVRTGSGDITIK